MLWGVEENGEGCRHECQDERMQHKHGKGSGVQDASLQTNVKNDQLDQAGKLLEGGSID